MGFDFKEANKVLFPAKDKGNFREIFENFTSPNGKKLIKELGESYSNNKKISDLCKKLCGEKTSKGKMVTIEGSKDLFYRLNKLADRLEDEKVNIADEDFIKNLREAYKSWLTGGDSSEALDAQYAEYLSKARKILLFYSDKFPDIDIEKANFSDITKVASECENCETKLKKLNNEAKEIEKENNGLWKNYKEEQDHKGLMLSTAVPTLLGMSKKLGGVGSRLTSGSASKEWLRVSQILSDFGVGLDSYGEKYLERKSLPVKAILKFLEGKGQKKAAKAALKLGNAFKTLRSKVNKIVDVCSKRGEAARERELDEIKPKKS